MSSHVLEIARKGAHGLLPGFDRSSCIQKSVVDIHSEFWSVCKPEDGEQCGTLYRVARASKDVRCRLCPGSKTQELIPCCWCDSWIHWKCSCSVAHGRVCASHFDVINPLDKTVVSRADDPTVPEGQRGQQVLPNTYYLRTPRVTDKPGPTAFFVGDLLGLQACLERSRLLYRKGDHMAYPS